MADKTVGVLFGMEDSFPWALINRINEKKKGVRAEPVQISFLADRIEKPYDLIVDRISHDVPFYRTFVKAAAASGATIINNPFQWSYDDKFFDNLVARSVDVAVPKTAVLPHKQHPPNTKENSYRNLRFVEWDEVFAYLGFPIFMKPAHGGGWRDVYKCDDPGEFFSAYDKTRDMLMIAQEAIEFTEYFRCYVIGREHVKVMSYDPTKPFHERYLRDAEPSVELVEKVKRDALALCSALGYDMNTVELAVRDGIPYAIDFMNPAPDADPFSVGEENFEWVVETTAEVCIDRALNPLDFESSGSWSTSLPVSRAKKKSTTKSAPKKPRKKTAARKTSKKRSS